MVIKLTFKLPRHLVVAVSGGADSMAGLHFLNRVSHRVKAVCHYNHNTGNFANEAQELVTDYCSKHSIPLEIKSLKTLPTSGESKEAFWRQHRYAFFKKVNEQYQVPIVTCHILDDCVEEYIINKLIRVNNKTVISKCGPSGVIRPFLKWSKEDIKTYCYKNKVPYLEDPSNKNCNFLRNNIRHHVVPLLKDINPGLYKQVAKLIK